MGFRKRSPWLLTLLLSSLLMQTACTNGPSEAAVPDRVPPDFAMVFCVYEPGVGGEEADGRVFVLEPCGTFRAAEGAGTTLRTFPEPTATLDADQREYLYQLVRSAGLLTPSDADRRPDFRPTYQCVVTVNGRRVRSDIDASPIVDPQTRRVVGDPAAARIDRLDRALVQLVAAVQRGAEQQWPHTN